MNELIKLENVWKIYKLDEVKVEALRGVSLRIKRGEFVAIMGPSGSGKSTLLHIIGVLDRPTKGKLLLDGKDVQQLDDDALAKIRSKKIGFVFQFFNLVPNLTALENVELPMIFHGIKKSVRTRRALELLEQVGLSKRAHHLPRQLSGGERQRVAIARALATDPELILADEPTGNLDSSTSAEIMDLFKSLHKAGKTIIVVTHDPRIARCAKKIYNIIDGKIYHDHRLKGRFVWG